MSVCDPADSMHAHFEGWLPRQIFADLPVDEASAGRLDALLAETGERVAAMILEPLVQGAGGMRFHSPETLERAAAIARARGVLVIADEIFTGFGRLGSLFACDQAGVRPDIVCLSKALTGGVLPLAATVASRSVFQAFWSDDPKAALMHGPTFMANPLACAAANASLDLFETEPRVEQARRLGPVLLEGLSPLLGAPGVAGVRALGALGVVQLHAPPDREALKRAFVDKGVWLRPFGDVVYLAPALNIEAEDLQRLTTAVVEVIMDNPAALRSSSPDPGGPNDPF
jgi:adenosylmethionine-8-amino-7-oxononanoate aminotransferase